MAADGDLTTLAVARQYLQKEAVDVDQDPIVEVAITAASAAIRTYLDRNVGIVETGKTHVFELNNTAGFLPFAPHDLRAATSVLIDTDQDGGSPLSVDSYRLYPRDRELGVYTYAKLRGISLSNSWGTREISITGDWGIDPNDLPADLEHWATVTVVEWIRADVSMFTTTFDAVQERVVRPEALPSAVRAGIGHLAHRTVF